MTMSAELSACEIAEPICVEVRSNMSAWPPVTGAAGVE